MPDRVLIAGVSARALATSAARAGYQVTALDAFADVDLRAVAGVVSLRRGPGHRFSPLEAAVAAAPLEGEMVAYTSNFENYPRAVARLAEGRELLGNPPDVLLRVRDPLALMRALRRRHFAVPRTRATPPQVPGRSGAWLRKPRRSGGGHSTVTWHPAQATSRRHYLQERIAGVTGSVLFAADGQRAVSLGLSRQLVGDSRFGAAGFRYCGSLVGPAAALFPKQDGLSGIAAGLATAVVQEFHLIGVNGIDFVARNGVPYPIEVNPRCSASMELLERARLLSIFEVHAAACRGSLPRVPPPPDQVEGKAVVFARRDVTLGDTRRWGHRGFVADIPHPGQKISRGHPICTVFASGITAAACYRLLVRRAATVYRAAQSKKRRAA